MDIVRGLGLIKKQVVGLDTPYVETIARAGEPYKILISCILSLRVKDKISGPISAKLLGIAGSPRKMLALKQKTIEKIIYSAGFYRNKTKVILGISREIINRPQGKVPGNLEGLLELPGVGRKTANLVLGLGFNIPAICVDTHVHRISNRLGWVKTKTPLDTELALMKIVPKRLWIALNGILVRFGQNICLPVYPRCHKCCVAAHCLFNQSK